MIPAATTDGTALVDAAGGATLDDLFRRAALHRPADVALVDPPHRRAFADGAPRHVTYASADRVIEAIAGRLHRFGLPRQSVVALQCPNMVEAALALLGVLRAGMIAAPLPLLWRRAEVTEALGSIGAKAIIAGGRAGGDELCSVALGAATEVFAIRYVCGFGETLPDGVISLTELFAGDRLDSVPQRPQSEDSAAELAVVTWETTLRGRIAVARNHAQLIAAGGMVVLEAQVPPGAAVLSTANLMSCAGIAVGLVPWLISGGTLMLHHGLDGRGFAEQCAEYGCDAIVIPGPVATQLAAEGLLPPGRCSVLGVWQAPERIASSPRWRDAHASLVDVHAFGEIGLLAFRREDGAPQSLMIGPATGSRRVAVSGIMRTPAGTIALHGPMVPLQPDAERAPRGAPSLAADAAGFVDTGFPCRVDARTGTVIISGPPAGIVNVGGYRFAQRDLQGLLDPIGAGASIAALPDSVLSHRLMGNAADRSAAQAALARHGANALVTSAFRERRRPRAA